MRVVVSLSHTFTSNSHNPTHEMENAAPPPPAAAAVDALTSDDSTMASVTTLLFGSPVNAVLTVVCAYLLYKLFGGTSPGTVTQINTYSADVLIVCCLLSRRTDGRSAQIAATIAEA